MKAHGRPDKEGRFQTTFGTLFQKTVDSFEVRGKQYMIEFHVYFICIMSFGCHVEKEGRESKGNS